MRKLLLAAALATATTTVFAAEPTRLEKDLRWLNQVSDKIYMITGPGGNIGLFAGEDGNLMIDDKFGPLNKRLRKVIKTINDKPIKFVVNTHWHSDHTGGNKPFSQTGSVVVAHENIRKRMSAGQFVEAFNSYIHPASKEALPTVTFTRDIQFHLDEEPVKVVHYHNAHTDGDGVIFFPQSNVVSTGDIFFNGIFPIIDISSGGTVAGVLRALDDMASKADENTRFIPGHGPVGTKADLIKARDMLNDVYTQVKKLIAEGKSAEEVVAANPAGKYSDFEGGFINAKQFAKLLYSVTTQEVKYFNPHSHGHDHDHESDHGHQHKHSHDHKNGHSH